MIAVGLIQLVILVFGLVRAKVLALLLGPQGVGIIGTIDQLVVTISQIAAFGIPFAAMKFMAAAHSTSIDAYRACFAAFARIVLGLSAAVITLGSAAVLFAPVDLGSLAAYRGVILVAMMCVPPTMMTILLAHTLAAAQMPRRAAFYNLSFAGSVAMAGLAGAWLAGIRGFYIGAAAGGATIIVVVMFWMARRMGLSVRRPGVSIRHELAMRPAFLRTALSASVMLVAFSCTMLVVRFAVIETLGEVPLGLLQSALALALSLGSVLATMNGLFLSPDLNRTDPDAVKFLKAARFANRVALLLVAAAVPAALMPALGLTVLFTSAFVPAALTLVLCLVWQCLLQLKSVYLQLMVGVDRPMAAGVSALISLAVAGTSVFALVGQWGLLAAPAALILAEVSAVAFLVAHLVRRGGMPAPWAVLGRFGAAAAAIGGAGLLFDPTVILPGLADLALRLAYALSALVLMWLTMRSDIAQGSAFRSLRLPGRPGRPGGDAPPSGAGDQDLPVAAHLPDRQGRHAG